MTANAAKRPTTRSTNALAVAAGLAVAVVSAPLWAQGDPLSAPFAPSQSLTSVVASGKGWRIFG